MLGVCFQAVPGFAQGTPIIVYVDSQRIFSEFQAYQQAQVAYQAEYDGWMTDLRQREAELLALQRKITRANQMFKMASNVMKAAHDARKAIIQNLRP